LHAKLDGITSSEQLFRANGDKIRRLVHKRMTTLFAAWMTKIGHKRPGVPGGPGVAPGPSILQAEAQAKEIEKQIELAIGK
jgi:hypothetical protein